jgi:SpoIID/LytB domain protein
VTYRPGGNARRGPLSSFLGMGVIALAIALGYALSGTTPVRAAGTENVYIRIGVTERRPAVTVSAGGPATVEGLEGGPVRTGPDVVWSARLASPGVAVGAFVSAWPARLVAAEIGRTGVGVSAVRELGVWRVGSGPHRSDADTMRAAKVLGAAGFATTAAAAVRDPDPVALGYAVVNSAGVASGLLPGGFGLTPLSGADGVRIDEAAYRGTARVIRDPGGLLNCVNRLPLEDYLLGVVPGEMPASWPIEALKAQAVAARNYALANLGRFEASGYDLCPTIRCQYYAGKEVEHPNSSAAVRGTAGKVATYQGRLITAFYHAHAGGRTENSEDVWDTAVPYLRGTAQTFEKPLIWQVGVTRRGLQRAVDGILAAAAESKDRKLGGFLALSPVERTPGGRTKRIEFVGTGGKFAVGAEKVRGAFGLYRFKNSLFEMHVIGGDTVVCGGAPVPGEAVPSVIRTVVRTGSAARILTWVRAGRTGATTPVVGWKSAEAVVFLGNGYGHGVGMSQWGAREMAALGWDYAGILKNFYRGVEVGDYGR